jgi:predicted RNase H-like nuclease (RuvC/YqgF family)
MEIKEEWSNNMALDLWSLWESTEIPTMEIKEESSNDMWIDLSSDNLEIESQKEEISQVFSLEEATEVFVNQLEGRKEQIANDIADDEKIIDIKESKIKNLRSEIADYKKSIKELSTEDSEIDNKIWLVSWKKQVAEIKSTTTSKVHNAKRQKA